MKTVSTSGLYCPAAFKGVTKCPYPTEYSANSKSLLLCVLKMNSSFPFLLESNRRFTQCLENVFKDRIRTQNRLPNIFPALERQSLCELSLTYEPMVPIRNLVCLLESLAKMALFLGNSCSPSLSSNISSIVSSGLTFPPLIQSAHFLTHRVSFFIGGSFFAKFGTRCKF